MISKCNKYNMYEIPCKICIRSFIFQMMSAYTKMYLNLFSILHNDVEIHVGDGETIRTKEVS